MNALADAEVSREAIIHEVAARLINRIGAQRLTSDLVRGVIREWERVSAHADGDVGTIDMCAQATVDVAGNAAAAIAILDAFKAPGPRDPESPAPRLTMVLDALEASVRELSVQVEGARAAGYAQAIADLRWLAEARATYSSFRETKNAADYFALSDPERAIHNQVLTARQIADLLAGDDDGMGWLPSWKWDAWEERRASPSTAPAEHEGATSGEPGPYTDEDRERYEKLVDERVAAMRKAGCRNDR